MGSSGWFFEAAGDDGCVTDPFWDQANKFTKCFPDLINTAVRAERGSAFFATVNGKIEPFK